MRFSISMPLSILLLATIVLLGGCVSAPEKVERKEVIIAYPPPPDEPRFYFERGIIGTGDAIKQTEEESLKSMLTGATTYQGIGFGKPFDVSVHEGRVFVTDTVRKAVFAIDFKQRRSFQIGEDFSDPTLAPVKPMGIATSGDGKLFVADNATKSIKYFTRDGEFLGHIGSRKELSRPTGIDVNPEGTKLFVVDTGGVRSERHQIQVYDVASGKLINTIGGRGKDKGKLNLPRDVKLGPDGLLYVTDGGNFRVQVFSQDGEFIRTWGQPGARLGQYSRPKGITSDPAGNIYTVDAAFGTFQIYTPKGELLMFVGSRSTENGAGKYMLPAGIDVDSDGRVYMVGQFYRKVEVYRPATLKKNEGHLGIANDET